MHCNLWERRVKAGIHPFQNIRWCSFVFHWVSDSNIRSIAQFGVGIEMGIRKTFTDYIDDVSTKFFDFSNTDAPDIVRELADRSNNDALANGKPSFYKPGDQRGDSKEKDSYMFAVLSINYKIKTGRGGLPRF